MATTSEQSATLEGWYLIEQLGHKRLAGRVSEVTVAGMGMVRVDIPGPEPLATVAAEGNHHGLLIPMTRDDRPRPTDEPFPTQTGTETQGLVMPFLTGYYGTGGAHPVTDPVPTVTTVDRQAVVMPFLTRHYTPRGSGADLVAAGD